MNMLLWVNLQKSVEKLWLKKVAIKYINTEGNKIKARDWFPFREVNLFGDISKLENTGFRNVFSLVQGLWKNITNIMMKMI